MAVARDVKEDRVDTTIPAYDRMAKRWDLIVDLLGGTLRMRAQAEKWLPKEPAEKQTAYDARLARTVLFEALKNTITQLSAEPFSRPVIVLEPPEVLEYLEADVDRSGKSLTQLGRQLFSDMATYGKCHVLVDFSRIVQNEDGKEKASIEDEKLAGARAVFVRVSPIDLVGWRTVPDSAGRPSLESVRIVETREESSGSYMVREVPHVRVVTKTEWQLWRKNTENSAADSESWSMIDDGKHTFGEVFLVTAYADDKSGLLEANPPLEGMAWLNLAHWQSMSDQRNILRFSRFGILFQSGVSKAEMGEKMALGPTNVIRSTNPDAKMSVVEHRGTAIGAGRDDLEDLERRMEIEGLQPQMRRATAVTATEKGIDENRNQTWIQSWIRAIETAIRECYEMAAKWHKVDLKDDFKLDIFSDFRIAVTNDSELDFLLKAVVAGKLSLKTFLAEIKRRGRLADSVEVEKEIVQIESEGPSIDDMEDIEDPEDESEGEEE